MRSSHVQHSKRNEKSRDCQCWISFVESLDIQDRNGDDDGSCLQENDRIQVFYQPSSKRFTSVWPI